MPAPTPRRAVAADAAELVRLRAVMFASMGERTEGAWQDDCLAALEGLLGAESFAASVVDAPDGGGLAACAVGTVDVRLPSPTRSGPVGHISSVATDEQWRRRGFARAVLLDLLDWFVERGVGRVELSASREGEGLYRSLGFVPRANPTLSWRPPA